MFVLHSHRFLGWVLGIVFVIGSVYAQGPLTPPGAPGPVMKTLSQVEPRTAITNLPFTINQPGSYYLTQSFAVNTMLSGITIVTNDVTLDLMGFTLSGFTNGVGVRIGSQNLPLKNVVVMNGIIRFWSTGVALHNTSSSRIEGLIVEGNRFYGIDLWASNLDNGDCRDNVIAGCTVRNNIANGIQMEAGTGRFITGNVIRQNTISGNNGIGIHLLAATGSILDNRIADNSIVNNGDDGIYFGVSGSGTHARNLVEGNFISGNTSRGIAMVASATNNIIIRNTAIGNGGGNYGSLANNTYGPFVTTTDALSTTNGAPALSPWANFSR